MPKYSIRRYLESLVFQSFVVATLIIVGALFVTRPIYQNGNYEKSQQYPSSEVSDKFLSIGPEGWTAIFTGVLTLATIVLAAIAIIQINYLRRADGTARMAAKAAKKSADAVVAAETAHVIEVIINANVQDLPLIATTVENEKKILIYKNVRFAYNFKNFGKTPAIIVDANIKAIVIGSVGNKVFSSYEKYPPIRNYVIGSSEETVLNDFNESIECSAIRELSDLYVVGSIKFIDIFGVTRNRRFRWKYDGSQFVPLG